MKGKLDPHISHIKNSQHFRLKGTLLLCILVLFTAIFVLIPTEAYAFFDVKNAIIDGLTAIAGTLLGVIVGGIIWILNWVGLGLLWLSVTIIKASIEFIFSVGYTPLSNSDTSAVSVAWGVVRDLANMSMIIILVLIGVGTILGLSHKGRALGPKLLFPLIAVALLINFTPVLTGMLIDLSNILAKFFFDESFAGANAFISFNPFNGENSTGGINLLSVTDLAEVGATVLEYTVALVFNLTTAFILLVLSLLLVMRVLALQLLVILSPLAFAAGILPYSKDVFAKWWEQFTQWLILPTVFGFFLWLAILILVRGGSECVGGNVGFGGEINDVGDNTLDRNSYAAVANNVLGGNQFCRATVMLMSLAVIFIGIIAGFKTSAIGASFVVKQVRNARGAVKGLAMSRVSMMKAGLRARAASATINPRNNAANVLQSRARGRINMVNDRVNERIRWGQNQKGTTGALKRFGAKATRGALKGTVGAPGKVASMGLEGASNKLKVEDTRVGEREKKMRDMQNFTPAQLRSAAFDASKDRRARLAALAKLIQQEENLDRPTAHAVIETLQDQTIDDAEKSWLLKTILSSTNGDEKINSLYLSDSEIDERVDSGELTERQAEKERTYNTRQEEFQEIIEKSKQRKDGMAPKMLEKFPQYVSNPEEFRQWAQTVTVASLRKANSAGLRQALLEPEHSDVLKELLNNNPHIKDADTRTLENILFRGVKEREERELAEQILQETTDYKMQRLGMGHLIKQQKGRDILFETLENRLDLRESIQQNSFNEEDDVWQDLVNIVPQWGSQEEQGALVQKLSIRPKEFQNISTGGLQYFQTQGGDHLFHKIFRDTNALQPRTLTQMQVDDPNRYREATKAIGMLVERNAYLTKNEKQNVAKYLVGPQGNMDLTAYNQKIRNVDKLVKNVVLAPVIAAALSNNEAKLSEEREIWPEGFEMGYEHENTRDTSNLTNGQRKNMDRVYIDGQRENMEGTGIVEEMEWREREEARDQREREGGDREEQQQRSNENLQAAQNILRDTREMRAQQEKEYEQSKKDRARARKEDEERRQQETSARADRQEELQQMVRDRKEEEERIKREQEEEKNDRARESQEYTATPRTDEERRRLERADEHNEWLKDNPPLPRPQTTPRRDSPPPKPPTPLTPPDIDQQTQLRGQRQEYFTTKQGERVSDRRDVDIRTERKERMRDGGVSPEDSVERLQGIGENRPPTPDEVIQRAGEQRGQAESQGQEAVNDRLAGAERRGRAFRREPTPDEVIQRAGEQRERDQQLAERRRATQRKSEEAIRRVREKSEEAIRRVRERSEQETQRVSDEANNDSIDDIEPRDPGPQAPP